MAPNDMSMTNTSTQITTPKPALASPDHRTSDTPSARPVVLAVLALVAIWGLAIATLGFPGFYLTALALVPVLLIVLVAMAWG
jgi:fatty acid desaturase